MERWSHVAFEPLLRSSWEVLAVRRAEGKRMMHVAVAAPGGAVSDTSAIGGSSTATAKQHSRPQ